MATPPPVRGPIPSHMSFADADIEIRPMAESDLDAVLDVQRHCYPFHLIESRAALLSRQQLAPRTCWIAASPQGCLGYLFAHPWAGDKLPALDAALPQLPEQPDSLFIHDLALHPRGRGRGLARRLLRPVFEHARRNGLRYTRLIAVEGAARFWSTLGYEAGQTSPDKTAQYGEDAVVMARAL